MKTKLVWRLKDRPTPSELTSLVNAGILTKEEAKEILVSSETEEVRDKTALESEIKFLRELVDKLSERKSEVVQVIKTIEVEVPVYKKYPWYEPYKWYCADTSQKYNTLSALNDKTILN